MSGQDLMQTPLNKVGEWWTAHGAHGQWKAYVRPRVLAALGRQNYSIRGFAGLMMTMATVGFWIQLPFHDAVEGLAPPAKWAPKDGHGHAAHH